MQQSKNLELIQEDSIFFPSNVSIFFRKYYKNLVLGGFFGLVSAIVYLFVTPPMFEATAQIRMAQISQLNPANPFGTNLEDPGTLLSRLKFPTNYSPDTARSCGYAHSREGAEVLSKALHFSIPKGVPNVIELKVLGATPEIAEACANAIFLQIYEMQQQLAKIFVEEAKTKLAADNERIDSARNLIAKVDRSGSAMSAAYLSARDELTFFLIDREKMQDLINSVNTRGARLESPIHASQKQAFPKKGTTLAAGLAIGFFLGLLLALARFLMKQSNLAGGLM